MTPNKKETVDRQGFPVDLTRPVVVDDEGVHTELSITEKIGGRWVNLPTIWEGRRLNPDDPAQYDEIMKHYEQAKAAGWRFPEFNDLDTAVKSAEDRSAYLSKARAKDLQAAETQIWNEEASKRQTQ